MGTGCDGCFVVCPRSQSGASFAKRIEKFAATLKLGLTLWMFDSTQRAVDPSYRLVR